MIAVLLTLSSIGKRVREIGTLRAIGWSKGRVVRQILGETTGIAIIGGFLGVLIGIALSAGISHSSTKLTATTTGVSSNASGAAAGLFGAAQTAAIEHARHLLEGADPRVDVGARSGVRVDRWIDRRFGRELESGAPRARHGTSGYRMTELLYDLQGVERFYGSGERAVKALAGIDLTISAAEFLAVEGPSGSGKSTLLQLLGALDRPTGGSLRFEGRELSKLGDRELTAVRAREIGFVFQSFNLIPTLNAAENVEAAMVPMKRTRAARHTRVARTARERRAGESRHAPSVDAFPAVSNSGSRSHAPSRTSPE